MDRPTVTETSTRSPTVGAQTDQLQGHLQQQLNLNGTGQGRNMFASRPAGLASLGEDAEAAPDALNSSQSQSSYNRQAGPSLRRQCCFSKRHGRHSGQSNNAINTASSADFRANSPTSVS